MTTLWRKAVRDLWGEKGRSVSIILALALGIAGFFAVLFTYAVLTRALNDGYSATNPPSAILEIERLDDQLVTVAAAVPGVQGAEARRTVRARVKTGTAQWKNLLLFVRRDFAASRIGVLKPEEGDWPPRTGEMAVERDAFQVARCRIGDTITVRTESGRERTLRVSGKVHDVGQAQARMENRVYGYVTADTLTALGYEPYYDELAIRVTERPLDAAHVREVAGRVQAAVEGGGGQVTRLEVPEPGQHPHAKLMGLLLLSISVFGFFIVVLSGVIVFNVLTALLAGQRRQIGVMKALGAKRGRIAQVFFLEAVLLGLAAVAVSIPGGLLGGRWLSLWLAAFLNFDIISFAIPLWLLALTLTVGIAVPIIAALVPVWLGTRVPVREALAPDGRPERVFGSSPVDRALARVGGLSRFWLMALRNTGRNRTRVILTVLTLAVGGIFFMTALNVRQTIISSIDRYYAASEPDLKITLAAASPWEAVDRALSRVPGLAVAEGWTIRTSTLSGNKGGQSTQDDIQVVGLPAAPRTVRFDLSAGRQLSDDARALVVNTALHERLGRPKPGSEVTLRIAGREETFRLDGVAYAAFAAPCAYVSRTVFTDGRPTEPVNQVRVLLADARQDALDAVKAAVEARLESAGIRILEAVTKDETRIALDEHMVMIYVFLIVVAIILCGIGTLGLITTVSLNVTERRREMGVLRAIGATPFQGGLIVVGEAVVVGMMAWLLAAIIMAPLSYVIGNALLRMVLRFKVDIGIALEPSGIAIWLLIVIAGSVLSSLWPARQAARASVHEALTYE